MGKRFFHGLGLAIIIILGVLSIVGSGGGEFEFYCEPAPQITSTPPSTATVGNLYSYHITAMYNCGGLVCNSVDGVQLPPGAVIDDYYDQLTWTPSDNYANTDVHFVIATETDFCGDRATQSWTVHVYPPPVIESFASAREAVNPGERTFLTAVFQGTGIIEGLGSIQSGIAVETPPLSTSTDFTLIVANSVGAEARQTLTVEVLEPPVIEYLTANPEIITIGETSTLSWYATGDISAARLEPLGIDVTGRSSYEVSPTTTTTFELFLSNEAGASANQSVEVEVVLMPVIQSFTVTPTTTEFGGTVLLTGEFQHGSGEIQIEMPSGFETLDTVITGEPLDSGELIRSTRFRLVVRNAAGSEAMENLFVPITGPGTFQPSNSQPIHPLRESHTATRLNDGRVFIAGGRLDGESTITTEIFEPLTETFSAGPNLLEGRHNHAEALLPDGRVLLVGGYRSDATRILNAEIFNPTSNTITSAGLLPVSDLVAPEAIELLDGRVLIVHGSLGQGAEVFDPLTEIFTPVGPFNPGHACIRTERLIDGKILVIDGYPSNPSEIFEAGPDAFVLTDAISYSRCYYASAALQDGRVIVTGGSSTADLPAEIFSPATGLFIDAGIPNYSSLGPLAITLNNGTVLVVGGLWEGWDSPWTELFDPATENFAITGGLRDGHRFHTATILEDGRVLVIGGCNQLPCDAELYTPP